MLSEFWYRVRTFPEWIILVHAAARRFHVSSLTILKRAIALYWHYSLGPDEAVSSGLVDPKLPIEAAEGSIGRWQLTRYQRKFNPGQWECLVEDKAVFYTDCRALGLPIPELYAVLDNTSGWTASGKLINGRAEWERFFAAD